MMDYAKRNGIELEYAHELSKEGRKLEKGKEEKKITFPRFGVALAAITGNTRAKLPNRAYGVLRIGDEWNRMGYLQRTWAFITMIATSNTGTCDGMDGRKWMDGQNCIS